MRVASTPAATGAARRADGVLLHTALVPAVAVIADVPLYGAAKTKPLKRVTSLLLLRQPWEACQGTR